MKFFITLTLCTIFFWSNNCIAQNVTLQWAKALNNPGGPVGINEYGTQTDSLGNIYMLIFTNGTTYLDPGINSVSVEGGVVLVKYDADGKYIWHIQMSLPAPDYSNFSQIVVDKSGNIYALGYCSGNYDFDPGSGVKYITPINGALDLCVAKYSTNKQFLWVDDMQGTTSDAAPGSLLHNIAIDNAGNCYISEFFDGTIDFDPGSGIKLLTGNGYSDMFVAKYDINGAYKWAFDINLNSANPLDGGPYDITTDKNGDLYIVGYVTGTSDFDPGVNVHTVSGNSSAQSFFLVKYNAMDGSYAWVIGGNATTGSSRFRHLTTDPLGNIYISGSVSGTVDLDPGSGTVNVSNGPFIAKYRNNGTFRWGKSAANSNGGIQLYRVKTDSQNQLLLSGFFDGQVDFDFGSGTADQTAHSGGGDFFVAKYDSLGVYNWAFTSLGSGAYYNTVADVNTDSSGNIVTTGFFGNTLDFDPNAGVTNLTAVTNGTVFFAKYKDKTSILPVTIINFSGEIRGKQNLLHWSTVTEQNNTGFEVQRSSDGNSFIKIGFVKTKTVDGNSSVKLNYDFADVAYTSTTNYYRLKQIDKDGKFNYSNIVVLRNENVPATSKMIIYPNPVKSTLNIKIASNVTDQIKLLVTDLKGKPLFNKITNVGNGESVIQMDVSHLSAGTYIVKLLSGNGKESEIKKFVKQ